MPTSKQEKRILDLLKAFDQDAVQSDEFVQVMQAVLAKMEAMKKEHDEMMSQHGQEMSNEMQEMMRKVAEAYHELKGMGDESKTTLSEELKTLAQKIESEIIRVETMIPDPTDLSPIEEKLKASVEELEKKIPRLPEEMSAESIANKLETLQGDKRLNKSAIKGLEEEVKRLQEMITSIPRGGMTGMRKIPIIKKYNLTSQINGVTKSFTLPRDTVDVIWVQGTQFPHLYDPDADWTFSGNTLTLGASVGVPQSGQTLVAIIEVLFYG